MEVLLDNNDPDSCQLFQELQKATKTLDRDLSQGSPINTMYRQKLYTNIHKMTVIIRALNTRALFNISMNSYIIKALKAISYTTQILLICTYILSCFYHYGLYKQERNYETFKGYFNYITPEYFNTTTIPYAYYGQYKYLIYKKQLQKGNLFVYTLHYLISMVIPFVGKQLSTHTNKTFCDLHTLPEVMQASNLKATPDDFLSIIILSISTFLWIGYVVLLKHTNLLEIWLFEEKSNYFNTEILERVMQAISLYLTKRINLQDLTLVLHTINKEDLSIILQSQETLERIFSKRELMILHNHIMKNHPSRNLSLITSKVIFPLVLLLNIFGIYIFKKTNLNIDRFYILLLENTKLALMFITSVISTNCYALALPISLNSKISQILH